MVYPGGAGSVARSPGEMGEFNIEPWSGGSRGWRNRNSERNRLDRGVEETGEDRVKRGGIEERGCKPRPLPPGELYRER